MHLHVTKLFWGPPSPPPSLFTAVTRSMFYTFFKKPLENREIRWVTLYSFPALLQKNEGSLHSFEMWFLKILVRISVIKTVFYI